MSVPIQKVDRTLSYDGIEFRFKDNVVLPIIELEDKRMRIGCWYITLEAFQSLQLRWEDFRKENRKVRIQG